MEIKTDGVAGSRLFLEVYPKPGHQIITHNRLVPSIDACNASATESSALVMFRIEEVVTFDSFAKSAEAEKESCILIGVSFSHSRTCRYSSASLRW